MSDGMITNLGDCIAWRKDVILDPISGQENKPLYKHIELSTLTFNTTSLSLHPLQARRNGRNEVWNCLK
jgi:hypothetical protein